MSAHFFKYQALGNDMIVIDPEKFSHELTAERIRRYCRRHFGIGADGICYGPLNDGQIKPFQMRFFNPDGSESEKSGNGLRVFARYLWDHSYVTEDTFQIRINEENIAVKILDQQGQKIATGMGMVSFQSQDVHLQGEPRMVLEEKIVVGSEEFVISAVSVGNPHCILFSENLSDIHHFGPILETAPQFSQRTNVQAVKILHKNEIEIAIWERGAGHTLASGTSATATAAAAIRHGYCQSPVTVQMEGGSAQVSIDENWQATLAGPVSSVFQGQISQELI